MKELTKDQQNKTLPCRLLPVG